MVRQAAAAFGEMEKARSYEVQKQSEMQAQPDTRVRWARIADRGLAWKLSHPRCAWQDSLDVAQKAREAREARQAAAAVRPYAGSGSATPSP